MATWTELLDPAGPRERVAVLPAADLREMLLDLPNHPNICRVVCVSLRLANGAEVKVGLDSLEPDKRMTSGASGPTVAGAGVQRDTVQPWRVTPVLGDVGGPMTAPDGSVVCPEPFTPPTVENAQPFALDSAGWLDGLRFHPPGETARQLAAAPAEKRSPGGIILETT